MPLIGGTIGQVVEKVDDAGQAAEDREGGDGSKHRRDVEQMAAE